METRDFACGYGVTGWTGQAVGGCAVCGAGFEPAPGAAVTTRHVYGAGSGAANALTAVEEYVCCDWDFEAEDAAGWALPAESGGSGDSGGGGGGGGSGGSGGGLGVAAFGAPDCSGSA